MGDAIGASCERRVRMAKSVHPNAAQVNNGVAIMEQSAIARRDFFYVGGEYAGPPGAEVMHGQMYA
ncbi:MAG TPA: hypothetical protein VMB84_15650, partial [Stellaceae bacterium]|nr:hypothetical protein [Stellaceae bacterium]